MTPLVSIIVPVYNAEAYIQETLLSIAASTYRPIEIVVVDDGSEDHSLDLAHSFAATHPECRVFTQANAGVSAARNHAIRQAQGQYILPVDADDLISPTYIADAVHVLETHPNVRVCGCRARMFGLVDKEWKLPAFSHRLLARKNMIPVTSLFRRQDWQTVGGFCEEDIYREDWDFWLSLFELGGDYHLLDQVGLYYRVLPHSRRRGAKAQKQAIVDAINRRHPAYLQQHLGGPLHYHRSWSRLLNLLRTEHQVGTFDNWQAGTVIHQQRNTLRRANGYVVKQFAIPSLWRGLLYGLLTKSKARRSYEYAQRLTGLTPEPIAYREVRIAGVLRESWYVCRESRCTHTFNELIGNPTFPHREEILQAIGCFTARLHQQSVWHRDYSGGNILFDDNGSHIEIVDLNRITFRLPRQPLQGFERLNIDREALTTMGQAYAQTMGLDANQTTDYIIQHRWSKHIKQHITNL